MLSTWIPSVNLLFVLSVPPNESKKINLSSSHTGQMTLTLQPLHFFICFNVSLLNSESYNGCCCHL